MPGSAFSTGTGDPEVENVISVESHLPPTETNDPTLASTTTDTTHSTSGNAFIPIFIPVARRPMASLRRLWTQGAFGADGGAIMPGSSLSFVTAGLFNFVEIRAQGQSGFPFTTHPQAIMVAVTSLIMYGFISALETVLSAIPYGSIIARLGKMVCLYLMVASLASLFYL